MTRIEKSDAQLNAEAEARRRGFGPPRIEHGFDDPDAYDVPPFAPSPPPKGHVVHPTLREERIVRWRAAYAAEPSTRLANRRPPEMTEKVDGVPTRRIDAGARIGVSMSGSFLRYLDGSGGRQFPIHDALLGWDRLCRAKHATWPDHRSRPVCAEIAWNVIRDGWSIAGAADAVGVSFPRAERLLFMATKWMHDRQEFWLREAPSSLHDREMCDICRAEDERAA